MNLLVTAGPTREAIDPVRFISNRSSGKMGYAVARAGVRRGHAVKLISGPVCLEPPPGVDLVPVVSAAEMLAAVRAAVPWCDVLVMTAAVADLRPRKVSPLKLKKETSLDVLELERTEDILLAVLPLKGDRVFIGFAAETHDVLSEAGRKLARKGLDLIVANDVSEAGSGFEVDTNRVTLLAPGGKREDWPLMTKDEVGDRLVARAEGMLSGR